MKNNIFNIFDLSKIDSLEEEFFEDIVSGQNVRVERIVSKGHITAKGNWYDQRYDEWVLVLQGDADIMYDDMSIDHLEKGDHILIPAHKRHRVSYTSSDPECIWLAVHFKNDTTR